MENKSDRVGHCVNCNIYGPIFLCSNCKDALYCSRHCQKADWKQHKTVCNISMTFFQESRNLSNHDQAAYGICEFCKRVGAYRCAKCKCMCYCTRVCQAADWKRHKPECKRTRTNQKRTVLKTATDDQKKDSVDPVNVDTLFAREYGPDHTSVLVNDSESSETFSQPKYISSSVINSETANNIAAANKSNINNGYIMGDVKDKHTRTLEMTKETKESVSDCNLDKATDSKESQNANCNRCNIMGCTQKCARCRSVLYCSKACQKEDWTAHKKSCKREYTEEQKRIIEERLRRKKEQAAYFRENVKDTWATFAHNKRFLRTLSPEKALVTATRPPGSLQKAIQLTKDWWPGFEVWTKFLEVPWPELLPMKSLNINNCVLVAFMYRYHEHVMRHGAYLKDENDSESKVEFYLDHVEDNPATFFTYSMVKPGNYICLVKPLVHVFKDGTVGFKIEDPSSVCIIEKDMLVEDSPRLNSLGGYI